jgi:hypothetical protein
MPLSFGTRSVTVVPAQAGTHNHRHWNMGPRLRGDDSNERRRVGKGALLRFSAWAKSRARRAHAATVLQAILPTLPRLRRDDAI